MLGLNLHADVSFSEILDGWPPLTGVPSAGPRSGRKAPRVMHHDSYSRYRYRNKA